MPLKALLANEEVGAVVIGFAIACHLHLARLLFGAHLHQQFVD